MEPSLGQRIVEDTEMDIDAYLESVKQNWPNLQEAEKERFCTIMNERLHSRENVTVFLDVLKCYFASDELRIKLLQIFNTVFRRELESHVSLPVIGGGVFLRTVTNGTQAAEMSLPLTSMKLDTSIPVNIHFWVVLLDDGRSLANDSYSPLLVCKNKEFIMEIRFLYKSKSSTQYMLNILITSLQGSSRQLSRYLLPIKFPFPPSLSHLPHPRSFLLTVSFSPTAPTCLYVDDYLCSQADSLFPFAVDASQLLLGADTPSLDRVASPPLRKKDVAATPGLLVHSLLLSQGIVGEESLSRKCMLGPAMGAYDQLPPRPEPAELLLPAESLELPGGSDTLVRRLFADFSATENDRFVLCLSRLQRGRRFGDVIESVPYENSCLRELVSRAGVDFLQNESLAFMILGQNVQMRVLYSMQSVIRGSLERSDDPCSSDLFYTLLETTELLLRADSSLLVTFYNNDFVMVLAAFLHEQAVAFFTQRLAQGLIRLLHVLLGVDRSYHQQVLKQYMVNVIFDPLLWQQWPRSVSVWIHDSIYNFFCSPVFAPIFTSGVSIRLYLGCVMNANINYIETVSPLLYLYLHNCTQPQEKKEFYLAVYETATQIIMLNPCPMYQLQNYIAFLYTHFASDFASDLSLAEEITQSSFVDSNLQQPRTSHFLSSVVDVNKVLSDSSSDLLLQKSSSDAPNLKQTISAIDESSTSSSVNRNTPIEEGKESVPLPPSFDNDVDGSNSIEDNLTVSSDGSDHSLASLSHEFRKISLAERIPWRDTVEKIRMSFLCNGKSYFDVVAYLIPFAETIAKAPLISITGFNLHELLLFAFFQEYYRMYNMNNSFLQLDDRIQRILSLQRIIGVLLKSCQSNFDLFTRLVCTYVVTLRECYRSINDLHEDGELLINLLQSEIIHFSDSLYAFPSLSSLFFIPHNMDYIPIPLIALGFLSQFNPKVLELTLECTDVIHLVSSAAQYAYTMLFSDSFSMISNRPKLLLAITGAKYMDSLSSFRIKCQSIVSTQQLSFHQILDDFHSFCRNREQFWQYYCQSYRAIGLHSKEQYLRHCTYYVLDPHMDASGVRRKMMRVYPPKHLYESARVHKEEAAQTKANTDRDMSVDSWTFDEITGRCRSYVRRIGSTSCTSTSQMSKSKELRELTCLNISTYDLKWGMVSMQEGRIVFTATAKPESIKEDTVIPELTPVVAMDPIQVYLLRDIRFLFTRSYNCQQSALEFYYQHNGFYNSVYLYFPDMADRNALYSSMLKELSPDAVAQKLNEESDVFLKRWGVTDLWLSGKMSNFAYLMAVNQAAGRSVQDITQYPVFPWLFNNYSTIDYDVNNVKYYRDLTLPMGAQNTRRLNFYLDRFQICLDNNAHSMDMYRELQEDSDNQEEGDQILESIIPPYYYGSHYSTPLGCVLHYLLRVEPYTSLHVSLQDNHFDVADRLFHSMLVTAHNCFESLSEIKELTPEWYFSPEFLLNRNHQCFGTKQDGLPVDNVLLPSSSRGAVTPEQMISRHIQALEGPVATTLLSEWIDLIFGFKQQGDAAIANYNLFYYMTYADQVDLTGIVDPDTRNGIITQAAHFGQCPRMVFVSAHPKRRPGTRAVRPLPLMLQSADPSSLFKDLRSDWLGDRCRIHYISDMDSSSINITPSSIQRVLGNTEYMDSSSCFFDPDSIYYCKQDDSRDAASLPTIVCPDVCISWPPNCHYPWRLMLDCNDFMVLSCLKVVTEDVYPDAINHFRSCFVLEYFMDEGSWKTVSNSEEVSQRTPAGIVTTLMFSKVCSRYWRLSIYDIPFCNIVMRETTVTRPEYTCGREELDAPSIPSVQRTTLEGPRIKRLDVFGVPFFPLVPPPSLSSLMTLNEPIHHMAIWEKNLVFVKGDIKLQMVSEANRQLQRTIRLEIMEKVHSSLLAIHPSKPVLFLGSQYNGGMIIVALNNSVNVSSFPESISSYKEICCFQHSRIRTVAADEEVVAVHGEHGVLSVFTLDTKSQFNSVTFTFSSRPFMTVATPKAAVFDRMVLCMRMDALVLFNHRSAEESPETLCNVLLYTLDLNLRAVFQVADIQDVVVSLYGIVVVTTHAVCKFDFCGNLVKKVELEASILCSGMSRARNILLCGLDSNECAAFDVLLMEKVTTIPMDVTLAHIMFNGNDTGFFAATKDNRVIYQHLNSSIPEMRELENSTFSEKGAKRTFLRSFFKKH